MKFFMAVVFFVVVLIPNFLSWGITVYVLSTEGSQTAAGWAAFAALISGVTMVVLGVIAEG